MRRFLGYLRRIQKRPQSALTRVRTDLHNCVYLHDGDSICIDKCEVIGFRVYAMVVRQGHLDEWPLYHAYDLREAYDLRGVLDAALTKGVRRFDARAQLRREREAQFHLQQEVAR